MLPLSDDDGDERIGAIVGDKYRIDQRLGRGGMGAVYAATHTGIGKRVALKFLDAGASRDDDAVVRFQREAQAASAIESAHIVHVFDAGTTESGQPYLVMELLEGEDLRSRLRRVGCLGPEETVEIGRQVLRGLARAHAANIVHRDLKPDNVFLCQRDDEPLLVKIVDFGISKITRRDVAPETLTSRGTVLGTASYMSPEQAQSARDIDGRADLWSVGAILFEALTGRPPHEGPSYESVLIRICTEDAPDVRSFAADVPPRLAAVIARALARDREERPETAEQFSNELEDALQNVKSEGVSRRRSLRIGLSLAAALALAGGLLWAAGTTTTAPIAPSRKPTESAFRDPSGPVPATAPEPEVVPVSETPTPSAAPAPEASERPKRIMRPAPAPRPKRRVKAPPAPAKTSSGVASGLRLNTREP